MNLPLTRDLIAAEIFARLVERRERELWRGQPDSVPMPGEIAHRSYDYADSFLEELDRRHDGPDRTEDR